MSFADNQIDDYLNTMEIFDDDSENIPYYDDSFLLERKQRPTIHGGVDWRYEKSGVFYDM